MAQHWHPRNLFFVRATPEPGPLTKPSLITDEVEARRAKVPWKDISILGAVEAQFICATLLGGDILPFGHAPLRPVLLPLTFQSGKPALVNYNTAVEQGYTGLADWLRIAEAHWQQNATKDIEGEAKIATLLDQINYRNKVTSQAANQSYKMIYNKSGTHIVACVLDLSVLPEVQLASNISVKPTGFITDMTTYYYESTSLDEAEYLTAIVNSAVLDAAIKPLQSRGLFGERDIHRRPFLFPIPQYNPKLSSHRKLAELGNQCEEKVAKLLPELLPKYKGSGPLRTEIRKLLAEELKTIDWHVARLFKTT